MLAEPQSSVEIPSGPMQESALHDQESSEGLSSDSAAETEVPSPIAPPFSPIVTMSSLMSTDSSSEGNGNHQNVTKPAPRMKTYKLVGDNIDKTIKPRDMRIDSQTRSLHYFHTYAVRDRIDVTHLDDEPSLPSMDDIEVTTVLPTEQDQKVMKGLFGIHVARVLKKHMPFFTKFGEGLERHIKHDYSKEMSQESEVVSVELPIAIITVYYEHIHPYRFHWG